jgi:predicted nucleic acid-binding protein
MEIVIDTSAIMAILLGESSRARLIRLTRNAELSAPASVHWEVGNALSALIKRRRLTKTQALKALESYRKMPIRFSEVDIEDAVSVAAERGLYAYDAYLITCAAGKRCALLTLDESLRTAASQEGVRILEVHE